MISSLVLWTLSWPLAAAFVVSPSFRVPSYRVQRQEIRSSVVTSHSLDDTESPQMPFMPSDGPKYNISLLLIDHYDSFTYNLYDAFSQILVNPPIVIAKDAYDIEKGNLDWWKKYNVDGIILSPGPGTPQEQPPLSHQAIFDNPNLPILGVCLGHQLMALEYGATVEQAPVPIHGQDHWITQSDYHTANELPAEERKEASTQSKTAMFDNSQHGDLFHGLPSSFRVVRYHSLAAFDLPDCLQVTARSKDDDIIQAIQHVTNPHYGVQFHPESIGTQHGMALVDNFCRIVERHKSQQHPVGGIPSPTLTLDDSTRIPAHRPNLANLSPPRDETMDGSTTPRFQVVMHPFETSAEPRQVFDELFSQLSHSVWLDSNTAPHQGAIDILASPTTMDDIREYHVGTSETDILTQLEREMYGNHGPAHEVAIVDDDTLFGTTGTTLQFQRDGDLLDPPFHYRGGYLGYLGYEVRFDTERHLHHIEHGPAAKQPRTATDQTPTAAFFLARRSLVFHHASRTWYMIALLENKSETSDTLAWMKTTKRKISQMKSPDTDTSRESPTTTDTSNSPPKLEFTPNRSKDTYTKNIEKCHEYIRQGHSYELCLTNQLEATVEKPKSTWQLYQVLREQNPAPFSAYFAWNMRATGETKDPEESAPVESGSSLSICCSSPERFMSVQRQQLAAHPEMPVFLQAEAKPIKGTEARVKPANGIRTEAESREDDRRARSLELSLKNRAENLMIVDLLRNDMNRVCEVGSVHVAKLMGIESFATVHQMVSTIRGTLQTLPTPALSSSQETAHSNDNGAATCIDLLRAAFPGGSMTGAPKIRTMELLHELEETVPRGPYAGSLGYLSVNGCMDMNIVIRSAVITPTLVDGNKPGQCVRIGAGGAITALSDVEDEYEEMMLKASAVVQAVTDWASRPDPPQLVPDETLAEESMRQTS